MYPFQFSFQYNNKTTPTQRKHPDLMRGRNRLQTETEAVLSGLACGSEIQRAQARAKANEMLSSLDMKTITDSILPHALSLALGSPSVVSAVGCLLGLAVSHVTASSLLAPHFEAFFISCDCEVGRKEGVKAALLLDEESYGNVMFPLLESTWANEVLSGLELFIQGFRKLTGDKKKEALRLSMSRTQDKDPRVVRKACMLSRDAFEGEETSLKDYKRLLSGLLSEGNDEVVGSASKGLIGLLGVDFEDKETLSTLLRVFDTSSPEVTSVKPRWQIAKNLSIIIKGIYRQNGFEYSNGEEKITARDRKEGIISIISTLFWDANQDVRERALKSVQEMFIKERNRDENTSINYEEEEIVEIVLDETLNHLETLATDLDYRVKKCLAGSLDLMLECFTKTWNKTDYDEDKKKQILQTFVNSLKFLLEEQPQISIKALSCINRLGKSYDIKEDKDTFSTILNILKTYVESENFSWRVLSSRFVFQLRFLDYPTFKEQVFPIIENLFSSFDIIVDEMASNFIYLYDEYGTEMLIDLFALKEKENIFEGMLYKKRIGILKTLHNIFIKRLFEKDDPSSIDAIHYVDIIKLLSKDPIINVRIAVAQIVKEIKELIDNNTTTKVYEAYHTQIEDLYQCLKDDKEKDVQGSLSG